MASQFYVGTSDFNNSNQQLSVLVQKKLGRAEICLKCVECAHIIDGQRYPRIAAVVECGGEYGIFIFKSSREPPVHSGDLDLVKVIAIDSSLSSHAARQNQLLTLHTEDMIVNLELTRGELAEEFVATLESSKQLHMNNAAFGNPTFDWLVKYHQECDMFAPVAPNPNPFAEDTFDPMRHMNLPAAGAHVMATDVASASKTTWHTTERFDNLSLGSATPQQRQSPNISRRTQSQDSLDTTSSNSSAELMGHEQKQSAPDPQSTRERAVQHYLREREEEYTDVEGFKVFCGTWNVNNQYPGNETLAKWMVVDGEPPDIYALGFQELDISAMANMGAESSKEVEWQKAVKAALHPKARYKKVTSIRLVGILLIVYIQKKHVPHVKQIDNAVLATGLLGYMGNKGGAGIRFSLHSTDLCFINCHLAAHQAEFQRRNQDYKDISKKLKFDLFNPSLEISEHDYVFWMGDLNYRIDKHVDEVKALIKQKQYHKLLEEDQLTRERSKDEVFKGFEEGKPMFDPTYRYDVGTDNYDTSEKQRNPAWCDRVLWLGFDVEQLRYSCVPELRLSDHKPVSTLLNVGIRVKDERRYKAVHEEVMKTVDRQENDQLPQIQINVHEFNFKDVKFLEPQSQRLLITNEGRNMLEFSFICKPGDLDYSKPWLCATPHKGIIFPKETCEVWIEVLVDKSLAFLFNTGTLGLHMEDILVLHLEGGKDSFITVKGNYQASTFGSSIEALVQTAGPIRDVPTADLVQMPGKEEQPGSLARVDISQDGGRLYMVPKEIWKMVDWLHEFGLKTSDLFRCNAIDTEIINIRDTLDTCAPERISNQISPHSVAEALVVFLECLSQSVVPDYFYADALVACGNPIACRQIVSKLPDCHKNVFHYILAFLRDALNRSMMNDLDINTVSRIFGRVMLRPPNNQRMPESKRKDKKLRDKEEKERLKRENKIATFLIPFLESES